MKKINEIIQRYRLSIFIISNLLLFIVTYQQFKYPVSSSFDFVNIIYSPYIISQIGIGLFLVTVFIPIFFYLALYKPHIVGIRRQKNLLIMLFLSIEVICISTFLRYSSSGIYPNSLGGNLGEFLIKYPFSWDRFAPSNIDYILGVIRLGLINLVFIAILFPSKTFYSSKKILLIISNIYKSYKENRSKKIKSNPVMLNASSINSIPVPIINDSVTDDSVTDDSVTDDSEGHNSTHTFTDISSKLTNWKFPSADILELVEPATQSPEEINRKKILIEKTLEEHGIEVSVDQIKSGPSVTMYGLSPGYGNSKRVRVDHILAREKDLALALASPNIRFQSPVPGESLVGVEIPNNESSVVGLRNLLFDKNNERIFSQFSLPIALGTGSDNQPLFCDLTKLPHLLVAGATGSGKSVCINSIISGFIMKKSPDDLRLIMIDPKRVELTPYSGIPHLLTEPIVEPSESIKALKLMIEEMTLRFKVLEASNSKNIATFNSKQDILNKPRMPYIVIIVDELADLMLSSSNEVEKLLVRLAQLGRATGIHLIVATQRPSVDIVTGLIKANFPSRISFSVTSQIDSRTIIDSPGAEKLLGKGDMLFVPIDNPTPKRAQGILISDNEIDRLVKFWKDYQLKYPLKKLNLDLIADVQTFEATDNNLDDESLIVQAEELSKGQKTLSTSYLQRRLRIGYPRAARLMDELEEKGVVGSGDSGKARQVL